MAEHRHDSDRPVRDYLLEFADAADLVSFEHRYFTDSEFLRLVDIEEQKLIQDYLSGRLDQDVRSRFEAVYLTNPNLAEKVRTARNRYTTQQGIPPSRNRTWIFALTGAAALACVAILLFVAVKPPSAKVSEARNQIPNAQAFLDVRLAPGVNKGVGAANTTVVIPSGKKSLRLILEMPGVSGPISCQLRLSRVEADGHRTEIASLPLSLSRTGPNTEAVFLVADTFIPTGDLEAELTDSAGVVLDRYLFQAK